MEDTYNSLVQLAKLYDGGTTLQEMAECYQNSNDECEKNIIIAHAFCKVYRYMYTICNKYYYLNNHEKASFAMEEIAKVLSNYDCSKNYSLTTLIDAYLNNRLRTETESINYDKRKSNNENLCDSYHCFSEITAGFNECGYDVAEFLDMLEASKELTSRELKFCKIVAQEPTKMLDCEIAAEMGINTQAMWRVKNSLIYKLTSILAHT